MFSSDYAAQLRQRLDLLALLCVLSWGVHARPARAQSVVIDIGSATGLPADAVDVTVSLVVSGGAMVAATVNDIAFNKQVLSLDPADCRVNPAIDKSLSAAVLRETRTGRTLRVFVQSIVGAPLIPTGPLYTCTFRISPDALPGSYALTIRNPQAFAPTGAGLQHVSGMGGAVTVTIVLVPSATPTPSPTSTATPSTTPTLDPCPSDLMLAPAAGPPGTQITFGGRCYFIHSGRRAAVYFDNVQVANVIGDTIGNYTGVASIPSDAAPGMHQIRIVSPREIAAASFDVTPSAACTSDCNGDGVVAIDDLLQIIAVILGEAPANSCPPVADIGNGSVTIDALLRAVQQALAGCQPPSG